MAAQPEGRLDGVELLEGIDSGELRRLEQRCVWRRYASGEQILDRNSSSRDVFFVAQGRVQVVNFSLTGREVAYASVPAGGFFGELSAIDGEPRSASVVAAERCLLAALAPEVFTEVLIAPGRERPVRFLGPVCLPDLYKDVLETGSALAAARRSPAGVDRALAAVEWLCREGYLETRDSTEL